MADDRLDGGHPRAVAPDIRAFYRTWYAPNNATIICVGDFDEAALLDLIATHYAHIPAAQLPPPDTAREPVQLKERVVRAPKPIATDRVLIGYKAPGQDEADWCALEIVATLLAGCPSARLYRKLVIEKEAASSVDAQLTPFRDPSLLRLAITTARGHDADEAIALIDAELAALIASPPGPAEVEKAKALAETDFWTSLVEIDGKAEALGHYETALGDFRKVNQMAERLAAVTVEDVARVARLYLDPTKRTIVIAEPEDGDGDGDGDEDPVDHAETEAE